MRLVLNRNKLINIDKNAFSGFLIDSLIELDLSDNNLQQIPTNGVSSLKNLNKLYLNRNRIKYSDEPFRSYASQKHLLKLELAVNKLTDESIKNNLFLPLTNLKELSLETNALTTVPSAALKNQKYSLTNLNLGLNQVKKKINFFIYI